MTPEENQKSPGVHKILVRTIWLYPPLTPEENQKSLGVHKILVRKIWFLPPPPKKKETILKIYAFSGGKGGGGSNLMDKTMLWTSGRFSPLETPRFYGHLGLSEKTTVPAEDCNFKFHMFLAWQGPSSK